MENPIEEIKTLSIQLAAIAQWQVDNVASNTPMPPVVLSGSKPVFPPTGLRDSRKR